MGSRGFSRRRRDIDDRHYRKSRCACPAEPGCREITKPPQQRNSLSQPIRDEGGRVFGNGARQECKKRRKSAAMQKRVKRWYLAQLSRRSHAMRIFGITGEPVFSTVVSKFGSNKKMW